MCVCVCARARALGQWSLHICACEACGKWRPCASCKSTVMCVRVLNSLPLLSYRLHSPMLVLVVLWMLILFILSSDNNNVCWLLLEWLYTLKVTLRTSYLKFCMFWDTRLKETFFNQRVVFTTWIVSEQTNCDELFFQFVATQSPPESHPQSFLGKKAYNWVTWRGSQLWVLKFPLKTHNWLPP